MRKFVFGLFAVLFLSVSLYSWESASASNAHLRDSVLALQQDLSVIQGKLDRIAWQMNHLEDETFGEEEVEQTASHRHPAWRWVFWFVVFLGGASLLFFLRRGWIEKVSQPTPDASDSLEAFPDHSFACSLADKITYMEMTLSKMDPSVKGYKQLKRTVSQMKETLAGNGYEIVDMLGKPFHEGLKATVSYVDDVTLEPGSRVVSGIAKPQVNYQGVMIQASDITVSQNL